MAYWVLWLALALLIFSVIWRCSHGKVDLDTLVLWGFVVSPLLHDYDLIQSIPLLETSAMRRAAILLSIPGWLVIMLAYSVDSAWMVFSWIVPGLLIYRFWLDGRTSKKIK